MSNTFLLFVWAKEHVNGFNRPNMCAHVCVLMGGVYTIGQTMWWFSGVSWGCVCCAHLIHCLSENHYVFTVRSWKLHISFLTPQYKKQATESINLPQQWINQLHYSRVQIRSLNGFNLRHTRKINNLLQIVFLKCLCSPVKYFKYFYFCTGHHTSSFLLM